MPTPARRMLRRIVAGDIAATARLYDSHAPRLYRRLARRYPELDAEDLLQETFLLCLRDGAALLARLLERESTGGGRGGPTEAELHRYLWDLGCGLASNRRRRAAVHRSAVLPLDRPSAGSPDAERETIAKDVLERLERCLGDRSGRTYLYYKLRYADGLSPEEISRVTGWSRKATYKLKQALDAVVRECLRRLDL